MDVFAEIAAERRGLADLLEGFTPEQQAARSLCEEWTVHDVVAHLLMPLEITVPRFALAMVRARGSFDRANVALTARVARRPFAELVAGLREQAASRFTPPGEGPEAPLTDLLVHGLDIRWPLGLTREIPAERVRATLDYLASAPSDFVRKGLLDGLRLEGTDLGWSHGTGPTVSGTSDALLMGLTGRAAGLDALTGDGAVTLRSRLA